MPNAAGATNEAEPVGEPSSEAADPSSVRLWGTKGIAFWALLSAVLIKARPESILELGGGRSTTFLADYAFRHRKRCVTVEESEVWFRKISDDLRFMGVRGSYVHHVPIASGDPPVWYEEEAARRAIGGRPYDMLFLDGPQGAGRRNRRGQAIVERVSRDARLIIVDDVHRPYNAEVFRRLAARFPPQGLFYYAYGRNWLAMGAAEEWANLVASCFAFLDLPYSRTLDAVTTGGDTDE
jgi:hypothetical protein